MVRVAKSKKGKSRREKPNHESVNSSESENDLYDNNFDPKDPFGDDEIESFHAGRDKVLLNGLSKKKKASFNYSSDEQEVLAFDDEAEDDDDDDDDDDDGKEKYDMEDDDDDDQDDDDDEAANREGDDADDDPSSAWGRKKSAYYSGNRIKNDDDALLEEEEALKLQAKMMKQLDSNDFGLDLFRPAASKTLKTGDELDSTKRVQAVLGADASVSSSSAAASLLAAEDAAMQRVAKDLSKMSRKEKLELVQQESPELFELVHDFKAKIAELEDTLLPVFGAIKRGQVASSPGADYVTNKTRLYLMYCSHLSFYFALKSQRLPVDNHPIVKNILQYRNLCQQISKADKYVQTEMLLIREALAANIALSFAKPTAGQLGSKLNNAKKSVKFRDSAAARTRNDMKFDNDEDDEDDAASATEESEMAPGQEEEADGEAGDEGEASVNKRAINYMIEKNKGLTPKRNKMYRNPRVKNRIKARKALIKRKSIVPKVRTQEKRYSGEQTGIRKSVLRGVKIK